MLTFTPSHVLVPGSPTPSPAGHALPFVLAGALEDLANIFYQLGFPAPGLPPAADEGRAGSGSCGAARPMPLGLGPSDGGAPPVSGGDLRTILMGNGSQVAKTTLFD